MTKLYTLSDKGVALIKQFEGLRTTAYLDAVGVPTIGYGHTANVTRRDVENRKTISENEAEQLLRQDVARFEMRLNHFLTDSRLSITQNQFDALICFVYNVGFGAFSRSTMLKKLYLMDNRSAPSVLAVANEFPRWNKAGGRVLNGLVKRRAIERALFLADTAAPAGGRS